MNFTNYSSSITKFPSLVPLVGLHLQFTQYVTGVLINPFGTESTFAILLDGLHLTHKLYLGGLFDVDVSLGCNSCLFNATV